MKAGGAVSAKSTDSGLAAPGSGARVPALGRDAADTPSLTWSAPAPGDEATRYLCAAAHVDPNFARRALTEFVFDDGRAPAPGNGVDEVLVLRHCLTARARRLHRDTALCVVLAVTALVSPWTVAAWAVWIVGLRVLGGGRGGTGAPMDPLGSAGPSGPPAGSGDGPGHTASERSLGVSGSWTSGPGGAPGTAGGSALARFVWVLWVVGGIFGIVVASGLARPFGDGFVARADPDSVSPLAAWLLIPGGAALLAWIIVLIEALAVRHMLVDRLRRDRYGTHRWVSTETVWARRALAELAARGGGDRHVLADPARPFAGSGRHVLKKRWLLETGPIRFDVDDLVERVTERLAAGVVGLDPEGLLESVEWDDVAVETGPVLVTGQTGDASLKLLPAGRPHPAGAKGAPAARVFRRFRMAGDPAETVVTAYLTGYAAPGLALIELHGLVLEPVAAAYRVVDRMASLGLASMASVTWAATRGFVGTIAAAPRNAVVAGADPLRRKHRRAMLDRSAASGLAAASGARTSLREMGVARGAGAGALVDREGSVFAREDANLCLAVVERRVREELRPLV